MNADTVVPGAGNPQALNRYSYVLNAPLKYTDPSGHDPACAPEDDACWESRWYESHGFEREEGGWTYTGRYYFSDRESALELLRDVASQFQIAGAWVQDNAKSFQAPLHDILRSHLPDGTLTLGIAGSAGAGIEVPISIGFINIDDDGNVALFSFTIGLGGTTSISASGGAWAQVTNAASIDELQGWFVYGGGSAGELYPVVTGNYVAGNGSKGRIDGLSAECCWGAIAGIPSVPFVAGHAGATYTSFWGPRFKLW